MIAFVHTVYIQHLFTRGLMFVRAALCLRI